MRIDEQSLGHAPRAHSSASHSTSTKAIHPSLSRILHPRGSQRKPRRPPPRPRRRSARVGATTGRGQARVGATTGRGHGRCHGPENLVRSTKWVKPRLG